MSIKSQPWMIFKPKAADVFYFWNGNFPIIVNNLTGKTNDPYYWNGPEPKPLAVEEIQKLDLIAMASRTKKFKVPGKKDEYTVVSRGVFEKEVT